MKLGEMLSSQILFEEENCFACGQELQPFFNEQSRQRYLQLQQIVKNIQDPKKLTQLAQGPNLQQKSNYFIKNRARPDYLPIHNTKIDNNNDDELSDVLSDVTDEPKDISSFKNKTGGAEAIASVLNNPKLKDDRKTALTKILQLINNSKLLSRFNPKIGSYVYKNQPIVNIEFDVNGVRVQPRFSATLDKIYNKSTGISIAIADSQEIIAENLKEKLASTGFRNNEIGKDGNDTIVYSLIDSPENFFRELEIICNTIYSITKSDPEAQVNQTAMRMITKETTPAEYYMTTAKILYSIYTGGTLFKGMVPRGGRADEKTKGIYDRNDKLITQGVTIAGNKLLRKNKSAYREHAVPCDFLTSLVFQKFNELSPKSDLIETQNILDQATDIIRRNLIIVLCDPNEAKYLDRNPPEGIGLQTTMPSGWKEGDDPLARFNEAKIAVYRFDGQRVSE